MKNRRRFWTRLLLFLFFAGLCAFVALSGVRAPSCFFHQLTGLYCPGCGSTRAMKRLAQGDVLGALRQNPLVIAALPFILYLLVQYFRDLWVGERAYRRGSLTFAAVLVAAIFIFFVLRNLPFACFDWLRPI